MFFDSRIVVLYIEFHEATPRLILAQNIKNLLHIYAFSCMYILNQNCCFKMLVFYSLAYS